MNATFTQAHLKSRLIYESSNGKFSRPAGARAKRKVGWVSAGGYVRIKIDGQTYSASHLAWFYFYGRWPHEELDHRDRDVQNNSIANLREASRGQNQQNTGVYKSNKSGYKGVHWCKKNKKWYARVQVNGVRKYVAYSDDPKDAFDAYQSAARIMHGKFFNGWKDPNARVY